MKQSFDLNAWQTAIRRRAFLKSSAYGLGGIALAGLLDPTLFTGNAHAADTAKPGERWRGVLNPPHGQIKARRVIHLCMAGGPSQFESFDYKPDLKELHGQPFPDSFTRGQQLAQLAEHGAQGARAVVRLPQARPVGPGDLRPFPAHRRHRRRHLPSSAR